MRQIAIPIAACVCLFVGEAHAKHKIIVFPVVPLAGEVETGPAEQMTRAIMTELESQSRLEAVAGETPAGALTKPDTGRRPARSDSDYRAALAALKEGAKQAQKLRFPQAIRALRRGIDGLADNLEFLDDYTRMIDAYVLLAVAYFRRGKQSAGTDVLETLARLRPDYELESGKYPPVFTSVYNKARERALARSRGLLKVTSAPEGGEVIVNGRRLGTTPLVIDNVVPGKHHVVVKLGDNAWGSAVAVRENETVSQHADFGAGGPQAPVTMGDAIAANRFDRQVRKTARRLGKEAGAEFVLLAAIGRGDAMFTVGAVLGNAKNGAWTRLPPLSPDLDMLSDTIEAHTLAREIVKQLSGFSETVTEETTTFIATKPVGSGKRGGGLREQRVSFVAPGFTVAAGGGGRGPVQATGRPSGTPEPAPLAAPTSVASSGRRPVGARGPVKPAAPATTATKAPPEPPAAERRAPLTRQSGGAKAEPGPVVPSEVGIEKAEEPPPGDAVVPDEVTEKVAAVEVADGAGPLAQPSLEAEADFVGGSIFEEWWFWTAVGAVVVAAAGTTTFLLLRGGEPDSVTIRAVW